MRPIYTQIIGLQQLEEANIISPYSRSFFKCCLRHTGVLLCFLSKQLARLKHVHGYWTGSSCLQCIYRYTEVSSLYFNTLSSRPISNFAPKQFYIHSAAVVESCAFSISSEEIQRLNWQNRIQHTSFL